MGYPFLTGLVLMIGPPLGPESGDLRFIRWGVIGEVGECEVAVISETADAFTSSDDFNEWFDPGFVAILADTPGGVVSPKICQMEGAFEIPPEGE